MKKEATERKPRFGHRGPGGHRMGMPVEKPKDFRGTLRRLLKYLKPYRLKLTLIFISAIFSVIFSLLSPRIMGFAITGLFEDIRMQAGVDYVYISRILFILGGLYLLSSLFSYLQEFLMADVAQNTVFEMRKDIVEKLSRLPLKFYDSKTHGEILSRVTNDVDNISSTLQQSITQMITSIVSLLGVVVMMLLISPVMTLIIMLTLPFYIFITRPIIRRSQKYFAGQQKKLGELNGHVEEMYSGHQIVKAYTREEKAIDKFNRINDELYEVGWKAEFISGIIMPMMFFIDNIGYILVSVMGAIFVTYRTITIGDVQAFIQYARQFSQPISQTANIANIIQSTIASAERVFEILDEGEERPDNPDAKVIEFPEGKVKFERVRFGYDKGVPVIKDMNIEVMKGQTVAIVGPTGAGKTTLVNLLMRFYDVDEGKITVDGVDIRDLKREELRSIFGMVLQDTWLFNGTIRDNIAYGREDASEEEIINAARAAFADHFIRTLPEGYNTVLNEDTTNISQGQKQLLTIARAFLADPAILILDEATSSVDTRTEALIQEAMAKLMKGRTNFVIAHRLSTIRDADLILVMNNGSIIEKGTHQELLGENGFYAELYNSQFRSNIGNITAV
jgi:ATP-binding cassette subfamily B protein